MNVDRGTMAEPEIMYEIQQSPELGRYLVAVRDIQVREIIIREDPLMSGPSDRSPKDIPVCLGCSSVMYEEPSTRCTTCRWPVCNADCEKLGAHSSNECKIFHRNHVMYPPPYGWPLLGRTIFILRCLLLKEENPTRWEQLVRMSDNGKVRRCKPNCINSDKRILENFRYFFSQNGEAAGRGFPETEVVRINGIIDTNAHAFPLKVNEATTIICNLYSQTSLMAHSCTPNASWSPDKSLSSLTLTIRANVSITKGSMLSVAYDEGQLLVPTLKRLVPNELNGMFICKCDRCLDPTEFGTYVGALKCPECESGYLLPIDPVDSFSNWQCDGCNRAKNGNMHGGGKCCNLVLDDESVIDIMEDSESMCGYTKMNLGSVSTPPNSTATEEPTEEDETLELLKEFVKDYSGSVLHPNHYILQEVSVRILRREYERGLGSLSDTDLIFFLERCERLLGIADILTPGYCEYRAFLQFHFSQGLLNLERRTDPKKGLKKHRAKDKSHNIPDTFNSRGGKPDHNKNCDGDDDDADDSSKTKQDHRTANADEKIRGGNCSNNNSYNDDTTSEKRTSTKIKEYSPVTNYNNHSRNLGRIKEMLTFLLTFFEEINSSHKLLEPIRETLVETEMRLKLMKS